jgi:acetyltransferase-like isoleucine patch superfamily enzyme
LPRDAARLRAKIMSRVSPASFPTLVGRALRPLRHKLSLRAHRLADRIVEARLDAKLDELRATVAEDARLGAQPEIDAAVERAVNEAVNRAASEPRDAQLAEHRIFGPAERLCIDETCVVNDALFNTVSGSITVEQTAFFGHDVALLTGTHDVRVTGLARQSAVPPVGRDIVVGTGAWIGSRATVLGPCRIGEHAVVAAGSLVREDVPRGAIVAGVPARRVGTVVLPPEGMPTAD